MGFAESSIASSQTVFPDLLCLSGEGLAELFLHNAKHDFAKELQFIGLDGFEGWRVKVRALFRALTQVLDVGIQTSKARVSLVEEVQVCWQVSQIDISEKRELFLGCGVQLEVADERFGGNVSVLLGDFPCGFD